MIGRGKLKQGGRKIDGEIIMIIMSNLGGGQHFRAKVWFWVASEETANKTLEIVQNFHIFKKLRISNVTQNIY